MKKRETMNGTVRGRLPDGQANPVDLHVGAQLKKARLKRGLTQEKLAEEMGITFQQVQKYEKGLNRIGASRLWDLAQVLGMPVGYFYEQMDEEANNQSPRKIHTFSENDSTQIGDFFVSDDELELLHFYKRIKNKTVAETVLRMVRSMAEAEENSSEKEED